MSRILNPGKDIITNGYGNGHSGVDVINDVPGLPDILAHSPGTVVFCQTGHGNDTGSSGNASYGNCVKLLHPGGMYTLYAHMGSVAVCYGQKVAKGQKLGVMGNTGNSYGNHLHFEARDTNGNTVNPEPFLDADLRGCPTVEEGGYTPGTYRVTVPVLTVRTGPGTDNDWLQFRQLSENAREQIQEKNRACPNGYVDGMVCDVFEVKGKWGKTPSGWICLEYCEKI